MYIHIVATVFTWDYEIAAPVWEAIKSQPVLSDEIQAFKTLITLHKIIRDGHPSALRQAIRDQPFLELLGRSSQHHSHKGEYYKQCYNCNCIIIIGYAGLINAYIQFLHYKLEFHTIHPEFTANMDYEEYRALKKVGDPNEG